MNLDQLKPLERSDLICAEIRLLADELIDSIGSEKEQLAELLTMSIEMELGCEEFPDSAIYPSQRIRADRKLAEWLKRHIRPLAEDQVNERLASKAEDVGMTVEQEDALYRARDLLAGVR